MLSSISPTNKWQSNTLTGDETAIVSTHENVPSPRVFPFHPIFVNPCSVVIALTRNTQSTILVLRASQAHPLFVSDLSADKTARLKSLSKSGNHK